MSTAVQNILGKLHGRTLNLCVFVCLCAAACSDSSGPPYIKAQVIDVYNKNTDIHDAHILYWWQERGETAFLATHQRRSKYLVTNEAVRSDGMDAALVLVPLRIPLEDIARIEWQVTGTGKSMYVYRVDGTRIETVCTFPQEFLVNPQSGLADYKRSIRGRTRKNTRRFDFMLDLDFVRLIKITGLENQEQ